MTPEAALDLIAARGAPDRARGMEAYHKVARPYLGVAMPVLNAMTAEWRKEQGVAERLALAQGLWRTNVFEARIAAGKLLTQARIDPDAGVWRTLEGWVADFDSWAIADHAAKAIALRLLAEPARLDRVETWLGRDTIWARRAALVATLPWARLGAPDPAQAAARERILGWAAQMSGERAWFLQKAVGWWLRELSKTAPERVLAFLDRHGPAMKGFARSEATRHLRREPG